MSLQLTFELADPLPPTLATFVAGPNGEAVDALARVARHELRETGVVLWGGAGAGKTHLIVATVDAARAAGREAHYLADASRVSEDLASRDALIALDDIDRADAEAQGRLFTLFNRLAGEGGQLVVASRVPPARLSLRDDVRTRLQWGLVYEITALADADKPAALCAFARGRGFSLSRDVVDYLLAHGRRDMATLVRVLVALDRHSLALRRPITVPLVRDWLQREMPLDGERRDASERGP